MDGYQATTSSDNPEETQYASLRDGKVVEQIDMSQRPNLMGASHTHEWIPDPDETEDYYAVHCKHCPMGMLITKHEVDETPEH